MLNSMLTIIFKESEPLQSKNTGVPPRDDYSADNTQKNAEVWDLVWMSNVCGSARRSLNPEARSSGISTCSPELEIPRFRYIDE